MNIFISYARADDGSGMAYGITGAPNAKLFNVVLYHF